MTVLAATRWNTNADMIVDVARLGYIQPSDIIMDLTYGRGKWWTKYDHPGELWGNFDPNTDEDALAEWVSRHATDRVGGGWTCRDYRKPELWEQLRGSFDVVVFDPPYVSKGGRDTSGITEFDDRYGLKDAAKSPVRLHHDNMDGMTTAHDLVAPRGFVMTKVMDYISSGQFQPATHWMYRDATETLGLRLVDRLIHIGDESVQPERTRLCPQCKGAGEIRTPGVAISMCAACDATGRVPSVQKHARNNYSMLYIFQKKGRK